MSMVSQVDSGAALMAAVAGQTQDASRPTDAQAVRKSAGAEAAKETQDSRKTGKITGRTIGTPKLTEKAAKYYEELKQKYSNMDFILVSSDMKEAAKAQAASFNNPYKMVVLIDDEKIERMAEDEDFRRQYEGILSSAASGAQQLQSTIGNKQGVRAYGFQINDGGTMSFFAVVDKSLQAQKERIAQKAAEKKEAQKMADRKAEKKERQEKLEQSRADRAGSKDTVTVTASSVEELLQKIDDVIYASMSDHVLTDEEKQIGQSFDFRM